MDRHRRSARFYRINVLLLIAASASGCFEFRNQPVATAPKTVNRAPPEVRITRHDGSLVIVERPTMAGDTIVGLVRNSERTTDAIRIPLNDVRAIASPRVSVLRTTVATVAVAIGALAVAFPFLVSAACSSQRDC